MPDLRNFSFTRNGEETLKVPKFDIICDIIDSNNGDLIAKIDIDFPEILNKFTDQELESVFKDIIKIFINKQIEKNSDEEGKISKFELKSLKQKI